MLTLYIYVYKINAQQSVYKCLENCSCNHFIIKDILCVATKDTKCTLLYLYITCSGLSWITQNQHCFIVWIAFKNCFFKDNLQYTSIEEENKLLFNKKWKFIKFCLGLFHLAESVSVFKIELIFLKIWIPKCTIKYLYLMIEGQ